MTVKSNNLKLICSEIFGAKNFSAHIVRKTGTPTRQGNTIITNEVNYVLVYATSDSTIFYGLSFKENDEKIYNFKDSRGKYLLRSLIKTGGEYRREDRPNIFDC